MLKKPIGLVVDNGADLSQEFIDKNQIEVVLHQVSFPDADFNPENPANLCQKMREMKEKKIFPKTSFASIGSFRDSYQKALEKFENILAIVVSSGLSGAFNAANQAKSLSPESGKIEVFDSYLVTVAEGLLAMKAQELISQNKKLPEILEFLEEFKKRIKLFGFLEDFSWVRAGGRLSERMVGIIEAFQKRGIRLALDLKEGKLGIAGVRFSSRDRAEAIVRELKKKTGYLKLAIAHADAPTEAQRLKIELERIGKEVLFVSEITPVLVAHAGPGALVVSYYLE